MGYKNKEIEKKYVVKGSSLDVSFNILKTLLASYRTYSDTSTDIYWHTPAALKKNADFIRVRQFDETHGELTVKKAIRGNTYRVEIDLLADPRQSVALVKQLIGKPAGRITKTYKTLLLDKLNTTVSLYKIKNDKRIFLEVEARSLSKVESILKKIEQVLDITYESRSLYQIFLARNHA